MGTARFAVVVMSNLSPTELSELAGIAAELGALLQQIGDESRLAAANGPHHTDHAALLAQIASNAERAQILHRHFASRLLDGATAEASSLADAEAAPPPVTVTPPKLESIIMANPTGSRELILIADDDAADLRQTETILTDADYRVITARDGFKAIELYTRLWAAIDLVILDFALPGLSGDLIFDELLGINPKVAAVVSGGFHQPAKLSAMLAKGLAGFMPKPFDRDKLLHQVASVIARRPR